MLFPIPVPQSFMGVFFFSIFSFFSLSLSTPQFPQAGLLCGSSRVPLDTIVPSFAKTMQGLHDLVADQSWGIRTSCSPRVVYGLAQCLGDLSSKECLSCFAQSRTHLPACLPASSGRIYLDGCFLRYDNYSFFNEFIDPQHDTVSCSSPIGVVAEDYMRLEFMEKVNQVIKNVTETAVENEGFGVAAVKEGVTPVYALAQCWKSVSKNRCRECLEKGGNRVRRCMPGKEGRALYAGCFLRYSTERFFSDRRKKVSTKASESGCYSHCYYSSSHFCTGSIWRLYRVCKIIKDEARTQTPGRLLSAVNKSNLNFKYETLEKATDFFSPSRKLGQGGAGSVFKGTLPDGRIVAVKQLIFNTRHWVDEFFNEVNLISGIQHKNLVKLLGCSIEGPESLLFYEFVPNKSLDQYLFVKNNTQILSWQQRFNIIVGIAEGLAYLHGGSQTRIIHRDIKSSNILLDENLTAKIADFGLVRCFAADKTHLSTAIAGTLGYMAPEYLVRGQLTEKADVYSFGVLLLEIVCGRKSSVFTEESSSVLQTVWKHYKSNKLPESVDPSLKEDHPLEQASDVLQIGLLCTQASVSLRPSMSQVVHMLTDKDYTIPSPMQPPFLNASVITDTSTEFFSVSCSSPNGPSTIEASDPSKKQSNLSKTLGTSSL